MKDNAYKPDFYDWYQRMGTAPPTFNVHGSEEDMQKKATKLKPKNWRMNGNKLICDTQFGLLINILPSNLIMTGTDKNGNPEFKNIDE